MRTAEGLHCPSCGGPIRSSGRAAFIEIGEFDLDTDHYEDEGEITEFECASSDCGTTFYV